MGLLALNFIGLCVCMLVYGQLSHPVHPILQDIYPYDQDKSILCLIGNEEFCSPKPQEVTTTNRDEFTTDMDITENTLLGNSRVFKSNDGIRTLMNNFGDTLDDEMINRERKRNRNSLGNCECQTKYGFIHLGSSYIPNYLSTANCYNGTDECVGSAICNPITYNVTVLKLHNQKSNGKRLKKNRKDDIFHHGNILISREIRSIVAGCSCVN